MRKVVVLTFMTLDGVMQAPGGPEEDPSGGFTFGGWSVPLFDEALGEEMDRQMGEPFDLLLGRRTFEIFATYWPHQDSPINDATKYVVSNTMTSHTWEKSVFLRSGDGLPAQIQALKREDGRDIQVHGSQTLLQSLLKHDLIDELWLKTFPVVLGSGRRLFDEGTMPAALKLTESSVTPAGVVVARYERAGAVETGTFGT
jgi:dihydrofolate reductase